MEEPYRRPALLVVTGALSSTVTLIVFVLLLVHGLQAALADPTAERLELAATRTSTGQPTQADIAIGISVVGGIRPNFQFFIFMLCEGETVRATIYDGVVYGEAVTLRDTTDHELIVALLEGNETAFPATARLFGSDCMRHRFPSSKWS